MTGEPKRQLEEAAAAIDLAVKLLRNEMPLFEAFLKECLDMENFGHIIDPTLYRDPERRAVSNLLEPLFKAALGLVVAFDVQKAKAERALEKVGR